MAGIYTHMLYSSFARRPLNPASNSSNSRERDGGGQEKWHFAAGTSSGDLIRRAIYPDPMVWCPLPFGATPDRWMRTYVNTLKKVPPGQLVIDVGALDGADAISMAMAGHRVISMDPTPSKVQTPLDRKVQLLTTCIVIAVAKCQFQGTNTSTPWILRPARAKSS